MPASAKQTQKSVETLFKIIQSAQDEGAFVKYKQALCEIRSGQKKSHWIWYVWPSLKVLRPDTSRPHFLLHDFAVAQQYLAFEPLSTRLEEITTAALRRLQRSTPLLKLMGSRTDAQKLHEALTVFALAAAVSTHDGADRQFDLFCSCLEAVTAKEYASLKEPTAKVGTKSRGTRSRSSGSSDAQATSDGAPLESRALQAVVDDPFSQQFSLSSGLLTTQELRALRLQLFPTTTRSEEVMTEYESKSVEGGLAESC